MSAWVPRTVAFSVQLYLNKNQKHQRCTSDTWRHAHSVLFFSTMEEPRPFAFTHIKKFKRGDGIFLYSHSMPKYLTNFCILDIFWKFWPTLITVFDWKIWSKSDFLHQLVSVDFVLNLMHITYYQVLYGYSSLTYSNGFWCFLCFLLRLLSGCNLLAHLGINKKMKISGSSVNF